MTIFAPEDSDTKKRNARLQERKAARKGKSAEEAESQVSEKEQGYEFRI